MSGMQIFLLSVGGLALVLGALIAVMRVRTIYSGARAQGTVVGTAQTSGGLDKHNRKITFNAPIVEFTHAGRKVKFTSSMGVPEGSVEGTKVNVRYLPGDPESSAEIDTPMRMWGFPVMALVVGGIFVGIALFANLK
jgi:hypothetical protein